jgi:hypothetical protein
VQLLRCRKQSPELYKVHRKPMLKLLVLAQASDQADVLLKPEPPSLLLPQDQLTPDRFPEHLEMLPMLEDASRQSRGNSKELERMSRKPNSKRSSMPDKPLLLPNVASLEQRLLVSKASRLARQTTPLVREYWLLLKEERTDPEE